MALKNDNLEIVKTTSRILYENTVWENIYDRYANEIIRNMSKYGSNSKLFQVKKPLLVYSSIGKVKTSSNTTAYDLRFAGQSVGLIEVNKGDVLLSVSSSQAEYAKSKFGFSCSSELKRVDWRKDKNAISFRRFFMKNSTHIPTLSLTEKENGATGGGIDILARIKHSAFNSRIAIIELKDENIKNEPQKVAMYQALIYATFLAHLLRSKSGKYWWHIFKNKNCDSHINNIEDVPNHVDLDVVTLMPEGYTDEGDLHDLQIDGLNVSLHLYTLYYKIDHKGNPCEFVGTLVDEL